MTETYRGYTGGVYRIDRLTGVGRSVRRPRPTGPGAGDEMSAVLAPGVQLLGPYRDSGFEHPRYLIQRSDGQPLQVTRLLYLLAESLDGVTDIRQVAERLSLEIGRKVSAENVEYLVANNLRPLGIVSTPDTDRAARETALPRSNLVLGPKAEKVLLPARVVAVVARGLAILHRPVVVVAALAAWVVFDLWLFLVHGAIEPLLDVFTEPSAVLAFFGLSVVAMLFHELGHASACRYSGARPGPIGVGIYLVWPAAYTDVSDVYRLGRAGRLRTDLGGVYFNAIFILGLAACYRMTGEPLFLAVAVLSHLDIVRQLIPVFRLDGYYILGDIVGVPELFSRLKPVLASLLPGHRASPRVTELRRGARVTITTWVLGTTAVLSAYLGYLLWHLPRLIAHIAGAVGSYWMTARAAVASAQFVEAAAACISLALLLLPFVGITYALSRPTVRLVRYITTRARR